MLAEPLLGYFHALLRLILQSDNLWDGVCPPKGGPTKLTRYLCFGMARHWSVPLLLWNGVSGAESCRLWTVGWYRVTRFFGMASLRVLGQSYRLIFRGQDLM